MMISFNIMQGNANQVLEKLSKDSKERNKYRLVVTSPPYYKHRNYGTKKDEIGQEKTTDEFIDSLVDVFSHCNKLLTDDGSLFIVIGDTRRKHQKLMIPHKLAIKLSDIGYFFQEDIIWYKKNAISSSSKTSLTQSYEYVLFLSKSETPYLNMDSIRVQGNEALNGTNSTPTKHQLQFKPMDKNARAIKKITEKIHSSTAETPFGDLPTTNEISSFLTHKRFKPSKVH